MSYLERLKHLETRQRPTDKTDKTTFVSSVSSMQARIERQPGIQQAGNVATVAVATPSSPEGALPLHPAADAQQVRAASEAASIERKEATSPEEREVVNWLERILESDPVVYRETLVKCRANPDVLRFFLDYARSGTVH